MVVFYWTMDWGTGESLIARATAHQRGPAAAAGAAAAGARTLVCS